MEGAEIFARSGVCRMRVCSSRGVVLRARPGRVFGIPFEVAVITNVTREHLDYHGTMEEYRQAKRSLFDCATIGVVNLDMEDWGSSSTPPLKHVTYSRGRFRGMCLRENISVTLAESVFRLGETEFHLALRDSSISKTRSQPLRRRYHAAFMTLPLGRYRAFAVFRGAWSAWQTTGNHHSCRLW